MRQLNINFPKTAKGRFTIFSLRVGLLLAASFLLAAGGIFQLLNSGSDTVAADLSKFQAGYIMSDYQMTNYNSMTESEIQSFLSSKATCSYTLSQLKSIIKSTYGQNLKQEGEFYYFTTSSGTKIYFHVKNDKVVCLPDEKFGDGTTVGSGETAAHIIWQAAQDYQINPQVLIVLLQKEMGLITDTFPNSYNYQAATGYGCPDSATSCDAEYYGFKNQVRNAAYLFRIVMNGKSSYYPIGNNKIAYSPIGSCGTSTVYIKNLATSALYRYTPYQPNQAALNAGYGTGDSCSSYGNRNFFAYFLDWFGDPTAETPDTVSVAEDTYYLTFSSNQTLGIQAIDADTSAITANSILSEFKITKNSDDTYTFKNTTSGKVLDVKDGNAYSGQTIWQYAANGTNAQKWLVVDNGDGTYSFVTKLNSGLALSANTDGTATLAYYDKTAAAQKFYLVQKTQPLADGSYIIASSKNSEKLIDVSNAGTKNGTNIQIWTKNATAAQTVTIKYDSSTGYYTLTTASGKVLDVDSASQKSGANVQLYTSNNTCAQMWQIQKNSDKTYLITNRCSGLALDLDNADTKDSTNIQVYSRNDTAAQKWTFTAIPARTISDGTYTITSSTKTNYVLDVDNNSTKNGANLQLYESNGTTAQKFSVKYDSSTGYYTFQNVNSGKVIDVDNNGSTDGTNIQMFESNDTCAQKWSIVQNSDKSYTIKNACSNKTLDVRDANFKNNTNIWLFSSNSTNAQKWAFAAV